MGALACEAVTDCPRCSGCGYGEPDREGWCQDCADKIAQIRPACWRCRGAGRVPCEMTPAPHDGYPHGVMVAADGRLCDHCDEPTPPGDGGCPTCWTPVPDNLADQKAMFADMGLSLDATTEGIE